MTSSLDISVPLGTKHYFSVKYMFLGTLVLFTFALISESLFLSSGSLVGKLTWNETTELINALGGKDAANYLRIGLDLSDGVLTSSNLWILNLWPPGMPALYTLLIILPGTVVPKMVLVSSLLWAVAGGITTAIIKPFGSKFALVGFIFFWTLFSNPFAWVLGNGILFSDGIGSSLLVIFLGLIFVINRMLIDRSKTRTKSLITISISAGLVLGVTLAFRWAFVIVVTLIGVFALIWAMRAIISLTIKKSSKSESGETKNIFVVFVSLGLGMFIAILPWTLVTQFILHPGNPTWSMGDYQWAQRWLTDDQLNKAGAGFLVEGNANWACEISPEDCSIMNSIALSSDGQKYDFLRNAAIAAAASHPVEFTKNRFDAFGRAWFSSPGSKVGSFDSVGYGIINMLIGVAFFILTFKMRKKFKIYVSVVSLLVLGLIAALFVAHLENRYLIPLITTLGVSAFTLGGAAITEKSRSKKASGSQV
jgi:hypothetical protein